MAMGRAMREMGTGYEAMVIKELIHQSNPDTPFVRLMRAISEDTAFPGVMKLRELIYNVLPYKDVRETWRVHVNVFESLNQIEVVHSKMEQSRDHVPGTYFHFRWQLSLFLKRPAMDLVDCRFGITDFSVEKTAAPEFRQLVTRHLKPLLLYPYKAAQIDSVSLSIPEAVHLLKKTIVKQLGATDKIAVDVGNGSQVSLEDLLLGFQQVLQSVPFCLPNLSLETMQEKI